MTNYVRPQLAMFREEPDLPDAPEVVELKECEALIEQNLKGYMVVAEAMHRIKEKRLYKFSFNSFEEYVKERWGKSRAHAYRMIASAEVARNLEAQTRPLSGAKNVSLGDKITPLQAHTRVLVAIKDPALQRVVWDRAAEKSGGQRPSVAFLKKMVDSELGRSPQGREPPSPPAPPRETARASPIEGEVLAPENPVPSNAFDPNGKFLREGPDPPEASRERKWEPRSQGPSGALAIAMSTQTPSSDPARERYWLIERCRNVGQAIADLLQEHDEDDRANLQLSLSAMAEHINHMVQKYPREEGEE